MVSLILGCIIFIFQGFDRRKIVKLLVAGLLLPVIAFASTTSVYALDFILNSSISAVGQRSGDSTSQYVVISPSEGGTTGGTTGGT